MNVFDNQSFEKKIISASNAIWKSIGAGYTDVLSGAVSNAQQMTLEDLEFMDEEEFVDAIVAVQRPLLINTDDAVKAGDVLSKRQGDIAKKSHREAKVVYDLSRASSTPAKDILLAMSKNNAAEFAIQRDYAQAVRLGLSSYVKFSRAETENQKRKTVSGISKKIESIWSIQNQKNYWALVADVWLSKARNDGSMSAMLSAGIKKAKLQAQLDGRTSAICRFLHGKEIYISDYFSDLDNYATSSMSSSWLHLTTADPSIEGFPNVMLPDEDERPRIWGPIGEDGQSRLLAIRTSGPVIYGDGIIDMGRYEQRISDDDLARTIGPPPYHPFCRTLAVPVDTFEPLVIRPTINYIE